MCIWPRCCDKIIFLARYAYDEDGIWIQKPVWKKGAITNAFASLMAEMYSGGFDDPPVNYPGTIEEFNFINRSFTTYQTMLNLGSHFVLNFRYSSAYSVQLRSKSSGVVSAEYSFNANDYFADLNAGRVFFYIDPVSNLLVTIEQQVESVTDNGSNYYDVTSFRKRVFSPGMEVESDETSSPTVGVTEGASGFDGESVYFYMKGVAYTGTGPGASPDRVRELVKVSCRSADSPSTTSMSYLQISNGQIASRNDFDSVDNRTGLLQPPADDPIGAEFSIVAHAIESNRMYYYDARNGTNRQSAILPSGYSGRLTGVFSEAYADTSAAMHRSVSGGAFEEYATQADYSGMSETLLADNALSESAVRNIILTYARFARLHYSGGGINLDIVPSLGQLPKPLYVRGSSAAMFHNGSSESTADTQHIISGNGVIAFSDISIGYNGRLSVIRNPPPEEEA